MVLMGDQTRYNHDLAVHIYARKPVRVDSTALGSLIRIAKICDHGIMYVDSAVVRVHREPLSSIVLTLVTDEAVCVAKITLTS